MDHDADMMGMLRDQLNELSARLGDLSRHMVSTETFEEFKGARLESVRNLSDRVQELRDDVDALEPKKVPGVTIISVIMAVVSSVASLALTIIQMAMQ